MSSFRTTRRVEFRDTDMAGIMHFSAFFTTLESVEHEFLRSLGLSVVMEDEQGPLGWPRVSASCEFRGAVKFEDVLDIELSIARLGEKSVTYEFIVASSGRRIAEGKLVAACCRLRSGEGLQAIAIPSQIADKLRPFLAS
jgi:acyl-CoA thioester hydrolase